MDNVYSKHKPVAAATSAVFFNSLRKIFLFLITVPLIQLAQAQTPHITSFHPTSAKQWDTVSISGTHLDSVKAVSFGGVSAQSFTIFSDSLIWAIVGTGASGYVMVATASASDSLGGFTFTTPVTQPPTISSFAPHSGTTGTVVTIAGTHFTGTTQVSFGGTAASFGVRSDTVITAVVGTGSTGAVKVYTPGGLAVATDSFTFIPAPPGIPHILSFTPDSARQGDTVSISGTHFDSVKTVSFGSAPAQSFTIFSDSLIRAIVGTGASGYVMVATASASDSLGGFIFISSDTTTPPPPPPVSFKLTSFTGTPVSGHAVLTWNVLHEEGIFFYGVEHSTDTVSSHFASIGGVVSGKLDSASYTFTDTAYRTGVNYYRLRIIDTVGNAALSSTIAVTLAGAPGVLSLYPNPAFGYFTVIVPVTTSSSRFVLTDASGHVVLTVPVKEGTRQLTILTGRFGKGLYKLVWTNGQRSASQTVLLLK